MTCDLTRVRSDLFVLALAAPLALAGAALAQPVVLDGAINPTEGYTLLTEAADAAPIAGGSATTSDRAAETATFHWWDGVNLLDVPFNDNRGDVINVHVRPAPDAVYIAVAGPTAPFNSFVDQGALASNDRGDLFIAIQSTGLPDGGNTSLAAEGAHQGFGQKAVDFLGWFPTTIIGVQFVDNGGGGGGRARVELSALTLPGATTPIADVAQNVSTPEGFRWIATIRTSRPYDTHNGIAGEFEIRVPWSFLGYPARPVSAVGPMRIAAYVTQNFQSDVYDSAPGVGNGTSFEELGDCPGDPDTGGLLAACNPGSAFGSTAGADFSAGPFGVAPGVDSDADTIAAYLQFNVPAACFGDADFDGDIDFADITSVLTNFNALYLGGTGFGDANLDGVVSFADVTAILTNWNGTCP